jgi:hypothetical protein
MTNDVERVVMCRVTPDNITELKDHEVFVFGSNESGRHGKGAAKTAMKWGAKYGQAKGLQGKTYGIPTVNASISNKLALSKIEKYVSEFIKDAQEMEDKIFLVTEVGCGLAGHTVKDIAPLFRDAVHVENIHLPRKFWRVLKGT